MCVAHKLVCMQMKIRCTHTYKYASPKYVKRDKKSGSFAYEKSTIFHEARVMWVKIKSSRLKVAKFFPDNDINAYISLVYARMFQFSRLTTDLHCRVFSPFLTPSSFAKFNCLIARELRKFSRSTFSIYLFIFGV